MCVAAVRRNRAVAVLSARSAIIILLCVSTSNFM